MEIDSSIKIRVIEGVYDPANDSYLLIEIIDAKGCKNALDMGCGTGIVALHLAKHGCNVTACDVNEKAVENTLLNARINNLRLKVIKSNLFESIYGKFDIIAFNPPYLPTRGEDITWDGGEGGVEVIDKFLSQAYKYLSDRGKIYMVVSSLTDMDPIIEKYREEYTFSKVGERSFFFEKIYGYKIEIL